MFASRRKSAVAAADAKRLQELEAFGTETPAPARRAAPAKVANGGWEEF